VSDHDIRPRGHVRSEQSAPVNPSKQLQTPHGRVHNPLEEHWLGHGVYSEANEGAILRSEIRAKRNIARNSQESRKNKARETKENFL
jgi:hypothetical protein